MNPNLLGGCAVLLGMATGLYGLSKGRFFSPAILYVFAHAVAFGFSNFTLFGMHVRYTWEFLAYTLLVHLFFLSGTWVGGRHHRRKTRSDAVDFSIKPSWLLVLFCVATLGMVGLAARGGGWPMLGSDPEHARLVFASGRASGLIMGMNVLSSYFMMQEFMSRRSRLHLLCALLAIVLIVLTGSRAYIIMNFVSMATLFEMKNKKAGFKILLLGVLILLVFVIVGFLRYMRSNGQAGDIDLKSGMQMYFIIQGAFQYLTNGYWNYSVGFQQYMSSGFSHTWGLSSISGILYWVSEPYSIEKALGWDTLFNERIMLVYGLNSVTYIWNLIKDFGLAGALALSVALGVLLQLTYLSACEGRMHQRLLYPFLAHQTLMSFNTFWPAEGYMSLTFLGICFVLWLGLEKTAVV